MSQIPIGGRSYPNLPDVGSKTKILIDDGTFAHQNAIGYAGENSGRHPDAFEWSRDGMTLSKYKFFTDMTIWKAEEDPHPHKVAILLEPYVLSANHYHKALELKDRFEAIFTHEKGYLDKGEPFKFYPFGGSWLKRWGIKEKSHDVSILTSFKTQTEGHQIRHRIVEEFGHRMMVFGEPYTDYLETKYPALAPFRYSVIVESGRGDYWFTEKLIDCFSQGTIPIYWGCPSIGEFFNAKGILSFKTKAQLGNILEFIGFEDWLDRLDAIRDNMVIATDYASTEDWIAKTYPWILEQA